MMLITIGIMTVIIILMEQMYMLSSLGMELVGITIISGSIHGMITIIGTIITEIIGTEMAIAITVGITTMTTMAVTTAVTMAADTTNRKPIFSERWN